MGCSYTAEELKRLAEVAREFEAILLSDEIYGKLHHKGAHISVARYYPEGTIINSGLSKWCGAGGWRLGTFTSPRVMDWLLDKMAAVASEILPIDQDLPEGFADHYCLNVIKATQHIVERANQ